MAYGIGLPTKMQQTGGNTQLIVQPQLPIATDPLVYRKAVEPAQDAWLAASGPPCLQARTGGRIFNDALNASVRHRPPGET